MKKTRVKMSKDEKKKLRLVKEKERVELRFFKMDKKFGDPLLRELAEQDATAYSHYKDWVRYRRERVVAVATGSVDMLFGLTGLALMFAVSEFFSGLVGVLLGLAVFELAEAMLLEIREDLAFSNMHNAINHHNYNLLVEIVSEAINDAKTKKETKTTKAAKKEDK